MRAHAWPWTQQWKSRAARAKAQFLVHSNAARRWRDRCWPIAGADEGVEEIYRDRYDVYGSNCVAGIQDDRARNSFEEQNRKWRFQNDVIFRVEGDITIEPRFSLAYLPGRRLIDPIRGVHGEVVPSVFKEWLRVNRPTQHFESLVHFDGFLGQNLWHFFADAFHGLFLLNESGLVPDDTPILIHERIWTMPLAQMVLSRPPFCDLRWIVQNDQSRIKTDYLYKGWATHCYFRQSYEFLNGVVEKRPSRNIFLDRRPRYGRRIANMAEIEPALRKYGFESIYAEDLSYPDQVKLMSTVRNIVGIHGAGFTNLLFSDLPSVRCLEVLPESYLNPHYYWMLQLLGADRYDAIVGSRLDADMNFRVDADAFERQLRQLVD
jgi:hypothetical protein